MPEGAHEPAWLLVPERIHRRRGRGGGDGASSRLGTRKERQTRALLRNASGPRGWQSVVKRIAGGSARTPQELKRLLDYVAREEGVQSTWCNLAGYERDFDPARTERTADIWSSTWTGAPRRGHADHIVLSFPRGVDAERAEVIAGVGSDDDTTGRRIAELMAEARAHGMDALVEVHDEDDLVRALETGAEVVGINNRNLDTNQVDVATTYDLLTDVPTGKTVVSESGISRREELAELERIGVDGALIGESLMRQDDVAGATKALLA